MAVDSPRPWPAPGDSIGSRVGPPPTGGAARVPVGVPDFDYLTGGVPVGSVILLVGEAGAGHQEFALTSAVHLMLHHEDPRSPGLLLEPANGPLVYPNRVVYVSATRSREQVMSEVLSSFDPLYHEVLDRNLSFHDLSPSYFADSVVPASWSSVPSTLLSGPGTGGTLDPLSEIARALEADGSANLVIVDSLTDLFMRNGIESESVLTLVKGLRRRAKDWGGVVYLILSKGVASGPIEQALFDSVDGVLSFQWTSSPFFSHRQRAMIIQKFMPVLSRIPVDHLGRFVIRVSSVSGLVTTQYERI